MIPPDDIHDSQELTGKLSLYIYELLENHDPHICKNVLTGAFASAIYTHFDSPEQIEEFLERVLDCVYLIETMEEEKDNV